MGDVEEVLLGVGCLTGTVDDRPAGWKLDVHLVGAGGYGAAWVRGAGDVNGDVLGPVVEREVQAHQRSPVPWEYEDPSVDADDPAARDLVAAVLEGGRGLGRLARVQVDICRGGELCR